MASFKENIATIDKAAEVIQKLVDKHEEETVEMEVALDGVVAKISTVLEKAEQIGLIESEVEEPTDEEKIDEDELVDLTPGDSEDTVG